MESADAWQRFERRCADAKLAGATETEEARRAEFYALEERTREATAASLADEAHWKEKMRHFLRVGMLAELGFDAKLEPDSVTAFVYSDDIVWHVRLTVERVTLATHQRCVLFKVIPICTRPAEQGVMGGWTLHVAVQNGVVIDIWTLGGDPRPCVLLHVSPTDAEVDRFRHMESAKSARAYASEL